VPAPTPQDQQRLLTRLGEAFPAIEFTIELSDETSGYVRWTDGPGTKAAGAYAGPHWHPLFVRTPSTHTAAGAVVTMWLQDPHLSGRVIGREFFFENAHPDVEEFARLVAAFHRSKDPDRVELMTRSSVKYGYATEIAALLDEFGEAIALAAGFNLRDLIDNADRS
jgi:hypothetical protein